MFCVRVFYVSVWVVYGVCVSVVCLCGVWCVCECGYLVSICCVCGVCLCVWNCGLFF